MEIRCSVVDNAEGAMDNQVMSPAVQQPLQIDEESTKENEAIVKKSIFFNT